MSQPDHGKSKAATQASPTRLWLLLALAFVATFLLIRGGSRSAATGRQADYSWRVTDLDGRPVDLAQYRGKPIFLNVWATWCPPCVKEMPSIARLAANSKLADVVFLCVSEDQEAKEAESFFGSGKPPMTILHSRGERPGVFMTDGIPATFVISRDGRIVLAEVGMKDWDDAETVTLLEGLVNETR